MRRALPVVLVVAVVLLLAVPAGRWWLGRDGGDRSGVVVDVLPDAVRERLPDTVAAVEAGCPELPAVWALALVPRLPLAAAPTDAAGVLVLCGHLRALSEHLVRSRKPTPLLDALTMCTVAACRFATHTRTGTPAPGEVGCDQGCVQRVRDAVSEVRADVVAWSVPVPAAELDDEPVEGTEPLPWSGTVTDCVVPDPTGDDGCLTPSTAHLLAQVAEHVHVGRVSCWDEHAWNPSSDHPRGRACDWTIGRLGRLPAPKDVAQGWRLARWLRAYADELDVAYVIWQGRIWSQRRDGAGWRPYDGGGVYDPDDPTGGHFDHVHVSLRG